MCQYETTHLTQGSKGTQNEIGLECCKEGIISFSLSFKLKPPMYQEISFTPTFKKLREVFVLYNEKLRQLKPHQYGKLSLKSTHLETAKELIRHYGAYLHKNKVRALDQERRFWITNTGVAKNKLQHRTTVYRHILILQEAGIITNKIFHGSNCGVEIEINKRLLVYKKTIYDAQEWIQEEIFRTDHKRKGQGLPDTIVANCNDNDSGHFLETNNLNMDGGDCGKTKRLETFGQKQGSKSPGIDKIKDKGDRSIELETRVARDDPEYEKYIDYYTMRAWRFAKSILYPGQQFTEGQTDLSINYIREYFALVKHRLFTMPFVERIFKDFCERILLARKYLDKSPERFIPVPWTYFDKHFSSGFAGTLKWLRIVKEKRERLKGYYTNLSFLCNQYQKFMHEPSLQNFKQSETELLKKKDRQLLDLYYSCVSDSQNYKPGFLHSYYKGGAVS